MEENKNLQKETPQEVDKNNKERDDNVTSEEDDFLLCPFLKTLVIDNNLEEREESLLAFQVFITKNKPSYKLLEDELMLLINKEYDAMKNKGENPLKIFVSRLLELYDVSRKRGSNPLMMKIFLKSNQRLKYEHVQDFTEEIKTIALNFWTKVDGMNFRSFLNVFEISEKVNAEELLPIINSLIPQKKLTEAVYYITAMNLHNHFDIPNLISTLVHQSKFPIAAHLVENNQSYQKALVNEMTTNKLASRAADYVKHFKLNPEEFPELQLRLQKNCLRYYQSQDPWIKIEEKFCDFKDILGFYIEDLVYKEEFDIALSIIKRHNLLQGGFITKTDTIEAVSPYFSDPPAKTYQYLENKLFIEDVYTPTEELIGEAPPGTYWNFKDFGIDLEKDMVFVETCESQSFDSAIQEILNAKIVGLDSEFRMNMTKFDKNGTALLQIAIDGNRLFLFDSLVMSSHPKYNKFLHDLFTDPKILKVGHTLSADLEIIKHDTSEHDQLVIRNHLDIPRAFKGLYPELKQSSLAYICEKITKKPMSKYEQISNWNKRPLRKSQVHYAAMDAYILLKIYDELKVLVAQAGEDIERYIDSSIGGVIVGSKKSKQHELEDEKIELEEIVKEKQFEDIEEDEERKEESEGTKLEPRKKPYRPKKKGDKAQEGKKKEKSEPKNKEKNKNLKQFFADEKYADFYSDPNNLKFVVDNMAFKLAKYMRNIGIDAEYISVKNYEELTELAKAEKRIIVTRDAKYVARQLGIPCFFLQTQKTADQLKEVLDYFKIKAKKTNFLRRCVKCNHEGLIILDKEEAKKFLQWKNEGDYDFYDAYWQCTKCKQIYWEGLTFKKAQVRFKEFASLGESSSEEDYEDEEEEEEEIEEEGPKKDMKKKENPTQTIGLDTELESFDFLE